MEIIGSPGVTHAGTFGANGSSMAAAKAVLEILDSGPVLDKLTERGKRLRAGIDTILTNAGIPHVMTGHPNMQGFVLTCLLYTSQRPRDRQNSRKPGWA